VLINLQPVIVFQEFNVFTFGARHPIIIDAKGGEPVLVGAPVMVPVRGGQMGGQLEEILAFVLEGFGWD